MLFAKNGIKLDSPGGDDQVPAKRCMLVEKIAGKKKERKKEVSTTNK